MSLPADEARSSLGDEFRAAMRRLAATVSVISTSAGGVPRGMTATAVCSLSADPPSILICVNRNALIHDALVLASGFCVNLLDSSHADVARAFSSSDGRSSRFEVGRWILEDGESPVLADAQASLICERSQVIAAGTHTICIGRVHKGSPISTHACKVGRRELSRLLECIAPFRVLGRGVKVKHD